MVGGFFVLGLYKYIYIQGFNMRLRQHINETNDIFSERPMLEPEDLNDLKKGCMPFLKDVKKVQKQYWHFLFRGFQRREGDFFYKKPRTNRRPTDSSLKWHKALDYVFNEKYGIKVRSEGVFCKIQTPTGYGMDYMIFPIKKYSLIYSTEIMDAYFYEGQDLEEHESWEFHIPDAEDMLSRHYYNTTLPAAVRGLNASNLKHEVALICKSYYAVDLKFRDQIDEWIKNEI